MTAYYFKQIGRTLEIIPKAEVSSRVKKARNFGVFSGET